MGDRPQTPFGSAPFLPLWGSPPFTLLPWPSSSSSSSLLAHHLQIGPWVQRGVGPSPTSFLARRPRALAASAPLGPARPLGDASSTSLGWAGLAGGVRGLSAQPRWRGGLPSSPRRSWGKSPALGRLERGVSWEVAGGDGRSRQAGRQGTAGRAPVLRVPAGRRDARAAPGSFPGRERGGAGPARRGSQLWAPCQGTAG